MHFIYKPRCLFFLMNYVSAYVKIYDLSDLLIIQSHASITKTRNIRKQDSGLKVKLIDHRAFKNSITVRNHSETNIFPTQNQPEHLVQSSMCWIQHQAATDKPFPP